MHAEQAALLASELIVIWHTFPRRSWHDSKTDEWRRALRAHKETVIKTGVSAHGTSLRTYRTQGALSTHKAIQSA